MFPPRNKSYFLRKERQEENRLFAWEMLGTKKMFYPKKYPKMRGFLDTVLDHLTSEAAGTHNFKDIANFHR